MAEDKRATKKILFSSAKMGVATLSSRLLGLVREQALALVFGASGVTDAFLVAYRIPNLLRDLFAEGAFSSAFVPVFTEVHQKDPQKARQVLWSLACLLLVVTGALTGLTIAFAPELLRLFTGERFTQNPEVFSLAVILLRVMAPFLVVISFAALFMGALNTLKVFFMPALAPAFFNMVMIASVIWGTALFRSWGYRPALALGVGVILGGIIQMLVQVPLLLKRGMGPIGPIVLFSREIVRIVKRIGLGVVGIAATQVNILVNTILATAAGAGAVSWLSYAFRLFQFPLGILGVSIAGSNLVHFSDAWKRGDEEQALSLLKASVYFCLLLMLPAQGLLWVLSGESVHLIYERGAFGLYDTAQTARALQFYAMGLPFYGLVKIFTPTFYGLDRPRLAVLFSVCSVAANILFCVILTPHYGFTVLAAGTSLAMFVQCFLQFIWLSKLTGLSKSEMLVAPVKMVMAMVVMCFVVSYAREFIFQRASEIWWKIPQFILLGIVGGSVYFVMLALLREKSLLMLFNKVRN